MNNVACAAGEATTRRDVAAAYRLIHLYALSDMTDGFVAARVPGAPEDFILGGYGMLPQRARASAMHRRRRNDAPPAEMHGGVDVDALRFATGILGEIDRFDAVIHAHSPAIAALSTLDVELLPISQWGVMFHGRVAWIDFDAQVSSANACRGMADAFCAGKEVAILRNHGVIVPGVSVADAFMRLYRLEQGCRIQLDAMATGAPLRRHSDAQAREWSAHYWKETTIQNDGAREWPPLLDMLDAKEPDYRT